MICDTCAFETDRLSVREWHAVGCEDRSGRDLANLLVSLMTEPVTRALPEPWRGAYTLDRAAGWIGERDSEGPTLLVVERATGQAVGLMLLFEAAAEDGGGGVDIRLGYLLAEPAWGRGLASELLGGFVGWCRTRALIRSLAGGVARDNVASARVLVKSGFSPAATGHGDADADRLFELKLRR
jgi:ribosomal-protein-alanine N-acetyltransferase